MSKIIQNCPLKFKYFLIKNEYPFLIKKHIKPEIASIQK